jgi:hypothetical protein
MPLAFGGGIDLALQSSSIGGVLGGWIATPQTTFPPSAVHSCAPDVEAGAGTGMLKAHTKASKQVRNQSRLTRTSWHRAPFAEIKTSAV